MKAIVRGVVIGAAVGGVGGAARARQSGAPGPDLQAAALKGAAGGAVVGGGIGWLVHRRGVARLAEAAGPVLEAAAEVARTRAEELAEAARSGATSVAHTAAERAGDVAHSAGEVARTRGGELADVVRTRATSVAESARPVLSAAAERAGEVANTAGEVARARAADAAARLAAPPASQFVDASGAKTVQVPGDPEHPAPIFVSL
jgi:hypothetical protein